MAVIPGPTRSSARTKRQLGLGARLDQLADVDDARGRTVHARGQLPEVGLGDTELVLHCSRGDADLLADDRLAGGDPPFDEAERDAVGVGETDVDPVPERLDRGAGAPGLGELGGQRVEVDAGGGGRAAHSCTQTFLSSV